jgi:PAS domain S-box-containing protein
MPAEYTAREASCYNWEAHTRGEQRRLTFRDLQCHQSTLHFFMDTSTMDTSVFFEHYYRNAEVNSIFIMNTEGTILDVNASFTRHFGFTNEFIQGQNFRMLFTESDREKGLPERELEQVIRTGQSDDENFILDRDGHPVWCIGESMLVVPENGAPFIVKDVVNLHHRRQTLQQFFTESDQLLEIVFESPKGLPMMVLNTSLKVEKANAPFLQLFELENSPREGSNLRSLNHPFWATEEIRQELSRIIIAHRPLNKVFTLVTRSGMHKTLRLKSKLTEHTRDAAAKIFILIEEVPN